MVKAGTLSFLERLVEFCELLRSSGFAVTPSEISDAASAIEFVDLSDERSFHDALKVVLAKKPEDYGIFESLFTSFWFGISPSANATRVVRETDRKIRNTKEEGVSQNMPRHTNLSTVAEKDLLQIVRAMNDNEKKNQEELALYSPVDRRGRKKFGILDSEDRAMMKRGLRTFARKMATRPGRRFALARVGNELDFRRTFRASLKTGGNIVNIKFSEPRISKSRLVFLCDVSGSMDSYSAKILKLLYYAGNTIRGAEVFTFSTELVSVSRLVQGRSLMNASRLISENVDFWSSGTRIGATLGSLISEHPGTIRPSTVLVIVSDGWELGNLEELRMNLREIKRRGVYLVWLNPHADSPNYEPLTSGMKAALPYLDVFSGLEIFTNRRELERVLGRAIHAPHIRR